MNRKWITRFFSPVLDLLLPHRCAICGIVVPSPGGICAECWDKAVFLGLPCCALCGWPFELAGTTEETLCAACLARRPAYDKARAALRYDDFSRELILPFKHADRTDLAPILARWLLRAGGEMAQAADMIAPVPLHWRRFWRRRYNQSALLAHCLADVVDTPCHHDLLRRHRPTPSQGHLSPSQRRRNVRGAFAVSPKYAERVAGRNILLVDDVHTSGATVEECARVLKRHGARRVEVLTLARVVKARGKV